MRRWSSNCTCGQNPLVLTNGYSSSLLTQELRKGRGPLRPGKSFRKFLKTPGYGGIKRCEREGSNTRGGFVPVAIPGCVRFSNFHFFSHFLCFLNNIFPSDTILLAHAHISLIRTF